MSTKKKTPKSSDSKSSKKVSGTPSSSGSSSSKSSSKRRSRSSRWKQDFSIDPRAAQALRGLYNRRGSADEPSAKPEQEKYLLRNWKPWDAGAEKRLRDERYGVARRIQSGSITEYDEIVGIAKRVLSISKLGRAAKSGTELTEAERKQLQQILDETSDTVFKGRCEEETQPKINGAVLSKINSAALSRSEACELCDQLKRVNELTLKLGRNKKFTPELRAKFEYEYDRLVGILHE